PVDDTTAWPYRIIAQLWMFDADGNIVAQCSGVLLNVDVVLTAAHCLWDDDIDAPYDSILVVPAQDGGEWPFGTALVAGEVSIPNGYFSTNETRYDFGL